jgi:hypothetical protein
VVQGVELVFFLSHPARHLVRQFLVFFCLKKINVNLQLYLTSLVGLASVVNVSDFVGKVSKFWNDKLTLECSRDQFHVGFYNSEKKISLIPKHVFKSREFHLLNFRQSKFE